MALFADQIAQDVVTRFRVDDANMAAGLGRIERLLGKTEGSIGRIGDMMTGGLVAKGLGVAWDAVTALGGIYVDAVRTTVDLASAAQDSELRLTSLLRSASAESAGGLMSFLEARDAARELRREMVEAAKTSPASFKAIEEDLGVMTFALTKAGLTLKEQMSVAKATAVQGQFLGLDKGVVARDVQQLLGGSFSAAEVSTPVLKAYGDAIAKLAKSGRVDEAARMIAAKLALSPEEQKAFGDSWTGQLSSLKDQFTLLGEQVGAKVLPLLTEKVMELNAWWERNQAAIDKIAERLGGEIGHALDTVWGLARRFGAEWPSIADEIVRTAGAVRTIADGLVSVVNAGRAVTGWASAAIDWASDTQAEGMSVATDWLTGRLGQRIYRDGPSGALARAMGDERAQLVGDDRARREVTQTVLRVGKDLIVPGGAITKAIDGGIAEIQGAARSALARFGTTTPPKPRGELRQSIGRARIQIREAELRSEDFARIMAPMLRSAWAQQRMARPLGGLGLGAVAVP